jgi:WD40 repeat protein
MEVDLKSDFSELSIEVPPPSDVPAFRIPNVVDALRRRELSSGTRRVAASTAAFCSVRAPLSLSQVSSASCALLEGEFDKAFSALWWDTDHVLLGTKNAKLGLWNTRTSDVVPVTDSAVTSSNGVYVLQRSPDSLWVAANSRSSVAELSLWRSADIEQTKELRQPTAPVATFQGHTDSIFGATWVDPTRLVTASRDGSLGIWRPPADYFESAEHLCISPVVLQTQAHLGHKVRTVTADPQFQTRCASLAVDASVAIWDLNRAGSSSAALLRARLTEESTGSNQPESSEVAAMCWNARHDFLSVGTRTHIVMIDARSAALIGLSFCFILLFLFTMFSDYLFCCSLQDRCRL